MSEIELHRGTPFLKSEDLNRLARQQELSVVIAQAKIFDQICQEVELPEEIEAELIQAFLHKESINSDSELEDYLVLRGWQEADLIYVATKAERLHRFQKQVFSQEVELNYLSNKIDLDQVSYTLICTPDADEAFEWHQRLLENEAEIQHLKSVTSTQKSRVLGSGYYGPHAISLAHEDLITRLRVGHTAQLWPPFCSEGYWLVLRLDQRLGTPLNDSIYDELLDELFEAWLNQRISQLLTGEQTGPLPKNLLSKPTQRSKEFCSDQKTIADEVKEIAILLQGNNTEMAEQQSNNLLTKHPKDRNALLIAHTVQRNRNNHQQALNIARQIVEHHPEYFDGYARGAQDLLLLNKPEQALELAKTGLRQTEGENNEWILAAGLRAAVATKKFSEAEELGSLLHQISPEKLDLYGPYLHALIHNKRTEKACEISLNAAKMYPGNVEVAMSAHKTLMRADELEACRWLLYRTITSVKTHKYLRYLTEELYHVESQLRQKRNLSQREEGCDVICIAANEGPYIHEFIHHYIYLGFKNIFVGVNNSEDQTLLILKKIREKYPQVHIVNVDPVVRPFMQWGCYHRLFDIALECSTSTHCLIVDIDEFWIADPFPTKINDFIRSQGHFDAFSFHWVEALDDILFDKPLSRKTKYKLSPWVKSLFSYETPVSRIGVHGPILNGDERDLTVRLGDSVNVNTQESLHGVEVLGQSPNTTASSPEKDGQAWVIHRANRSEIEYSAKLFRPHANDDPNQVSLKSNRYGWEKQDSHDPLITNYIQGLIGKKELETYHQSLGQFENSCRIKNDINESRIPFSQDQVIEKINSIDISLLKRDSDIAFRAFNGTRFLNAISKRLEEPSQLI